MVLVGGETEFGFFRLDFRIGKISGGLRRRKEVKMHRRAGFLFFLWMLFVKFGQILKRMDQECLCRDSQARMQY